MRPGQTAPEFEDGIPPTCAAGRSFNEAGADCPGIPPMEWYVVYMPDKLQ